MRRKWKRMITVAYYMNIWYVNELKELLISRLPSHGIAVKNLLVSFFCKSDLGPARLYTVILQTSSRGFHLNTTGRSKITASAVRGNRKLQVHQQTPIQHLSHRHNEPNFKSPVYIRLIINVHDSSLHKHVKSVEGAAALCRLLVITLHYQLHTSYRNV